MGKPGCSRLPRTEETGGSNPPALTISAAVAQSEEQGVAYAQTSDRNRSAAPFFAWIAQSVERLFEEQEIAGSIPAPGTSFGVRAGSAGFPCKEAEVGLSPRCSTSYWQMTER